MKTKDQKRFSAVQRAINFYTPNGYKNPVMPLHVYFSVVNALSKLPEGREKEELKQKLDNLCVASIYDQIVI